VLGIAASAAVCTAPLAFAEHADGGHCEYGDVAVASSCDTHSDGDQRETRPGLGDPLQEANPVAA
jgi:hypothetical protein